MPPTSCRLHEFSFVTHIASSSMEHALSLLPRLGSPSKHSQVTGGSSLAFWSARVGKLPPSENSQVMLALDNPQMPGSSVNLVFKTQITAQAAQFADREKVGLAALATPEGKKYEASWGDVVGPTFKACVPTGSAASGGDLGKFVLIANVSNSGTVSDVDVRPSTRVSRCFAEHFVASKLPRPPATESVSTPFPIADTFVVFKGKDAP